MLESLVTNREEFLSKYWDKKPYVIKQNSLDCLVSLDDLDRLLCEQVLRTPTDLRVTNNGRMIDASYFSHPVNMSNSSISNTAENIVIPELAIKLFEKGNTLVFQGLNNHIIKVNEFCTQLALELESVTGANAYLSPSDSNGAMHFDYHDVFIIQIYGEKQWEVRSPLIPLPDESVASQSDQPGSIVLKHALKQGEILYLPRGYWHFCETGEQFSLHVTISVNVQTYSNIIKSAVSQFISDDSYRRSAVPRQNINITMDQAILDRTVADLEFYIQQELENHKLKLMSNIGYKSTTQLKSKLVPFEIDINDCLRPVAPWSWRLQEKKDLLVIESGYKSMNFPVEMLGTLKQLMKGGSITVKNLLKGYKDDVLLALSREMIRNALVTALKES